MGQIIITDKGGKEAELERINIDDENATFLLAVALISICRSAGVTKEKLNLAMSNLWDEGSVTEEEE